MRTKIESHHPMAKFIESITADLRAFIEAQQVFFVATGMAEGRINLSPKGLDSLRVVDERSVLWLNLSGSGNETATHLREDGRITLMFCAFEGRPKILRLYGTAKAWHPDEPRWAELRPQLPETPGARQVIEMQVESLQTSCGFGVPEYTFQGQREMLFDWAEKKEAGDGLEHYWQTKNHTSIDGHKTGILPEDR